MAPPPGKKSKKSPTVDPAVLDKNPNPSKKSSTSTKSDKHEVKRKIPSTGAAAGKNSTKKVDKKSNPINSVIPGSSSTLLKEKDKQKAEAASCSTTTTSKSHDVDNIHAFISRIVEQRKNAAESISKFNFAKQRCRYLTTEQRLPAKHNGIIYWMSRDQRVQDNWALLFAQRMAIKEKVPLIVCFCLVPKFLQATLRMYGFMLRGLQTVRKELHELKIPFHLLLGEAPTILPEFAKAHNVGGIVTDFSPLRVPQQWTQNLVKNLPKSVALVQVDAHNIVPLWVTSDKLEYAARTIRPKIHNHLKTYLTEFPPVVEHPYSSQTQMPKEDPFQDWDKLIGYLEIDKTVEEVQWAKPGTSEGLQVLEEFIDKKVKHFDKERNNPNADVLSNLSPWFHFGQISVARAILEVNKIQADGKASFIEEAVVRRELSDNFCFYNDKYDLLDGAYDWARQTLNDHKKDKRKPLYTLPQFENAETYDDLWNAAQMQMVTEGKMHGFLRMYWAKKILEWSESPEKALEISIYLNDKYSLDGRDPNGYVGCMWSICGIHDQGWKEREIFGKIRFMNYKGCERKFDVPKFVSRYKKKKIESAKSTKAK